MIGTDPYAAGPSRGADGGDGPTFARSVRGPVALATAVGVLAGVGGGVGAGVGAHEHHRPIHWAVLVAVAAGGTGLVVAVVLLTWWLMWRSPTYRAALTAGTWRTRRRVGVALRKGQPVPADQRAVAAAIVRAQQRQWWMPWLFLVLAAVFAVQAAGGHGQFRWVLGGCAVSYVLLAPYMLVVRRKVLANAARQHLLEPGDGSLHPGGQP